MNPFKGAVLLDDFNRDDGSVYVAGGASIWSTGAVAPGSNGLNITGNQLYASGADGRTLDDYGPDVGVYMTLATLMGEGEGYVFVPLRVHEAGTSTWDGYAAIFIRTGALSYIHQIRRYIDGSSTVLGGTVSSQALAAGDKIGFKVLGEVLSLWRQPSGGEWEELGSREDATLTEAGPIGLETTLGTRLDDLYVWEPGEGEEEETEPDPPNVQVRADDTWNDAAFEVAGA